MNLKNYISFFLCVCIVNICFGQNNLIDSSFGVDGHVEPRFDRERHSRQTIIDKKGRVMVVKDTVLNESDEATVFYRYNQNGQIDLTFNNNGRVIVNVDLGDINEEEGESFYTHAFLHDHRIILNIYTSSPNYLDHLVMLNENGTFNNQFGNAGISALSEEVYVDAIAVTPDNKIIVAESVDDFRIDLYKYLTTGNYDNGFGTAGIKTINLNSIGTTMYTDDILINSIGEIFVSGESETDDGTLVIVKLNAAGNVIDEYGQNGVVEYYYEMSEGDYFYFYNPKFNADGKLMFFSHEEEMRASALVRFNTNGEPDNSFGNIGNGLLLLFTYSLSLNGDFLYYDYEPTSGTGIWLCGISKEQNLYKYVVSKRQSNGTTPEFSFGSGGNATFTINSHDAIAYAIKEIADGKLLVMGNALINNYYGLSIIRSQANGQMDNSYGSNGILNIRSDFDNQYSNLLTPLSHITSGANNSVLFTGIYNDAGFNNGSIYVANLAENGSPVNTFGQNGFAPITTLNGTKNDTGKIIRQPDGKIVVAYLVDDLFSYYRGATLLLQRLTATGQPDPSFGIGGRTLYRSNFIPENSDIKILDVKPAPNGKIGVLVSVKNQEYNLVSTTYIQFTQNGSVDNTFNSYGEITPTFLPTHLAFSNANKPILMGNGYTESQICCAGLLVQRFNQNGTIDNTFNGGNARQIQSASEDADGVGLFVEAEDNITILFNPDHSNKDYGIAKLTANGLPLAGFGTNGVLLGLSGADDFDYGIKLENGGYMFAGNYQHDLVLFKITNAGTPDGTFGVTGLGKINYSSQYEQYGLEGGIVEKSGGKIVAGHNEFSNNNYQTAYIAQIKTAPSIATIYTLINPGNWSNPANWQTGQVPPSIITPGMEIIINPGGNGIATLDINVIVQLGGKIRVMPSKRLNVNAMLTVPSIQ